MIDVFIKKNSSSEKNTGSNNTIFKLVCVVCFLFSIYNYIIHFNTPFISEEAQPIKAVEFVKENLDYKNIRFFNDYNNGAYLLFNGIPVFLDSRCDLYTCGFNENVNVLDDYMDVLYRKKYC